MTQRTIMKWSFLEFGKRLRSSLSFFSLGLLLVDSSLAQPPDFAWATRIGGVNYDHTGTVAVDRQGNLLVVGSFVGPATFGTNAPINSPGAHFVVAKYERNGTLLWVRYTESGLFWTGNPIAFDSAGNAYVAGRYKGTVQMGGLTVTGSTNTGNIFLFKLDPAGQVAWVKGVRAGDVESYPRLAVDSAGQAILAGTFEGHATFGTNHLASVGEYDLFVAKFDGNGQVLWAKQGAGPDHKSAHAVVTDADHNVWVSGNFSVRIDFVHSGAGGDPATAGSCGIWSRDRGRRDEGAGPWAHGPPPGCPAVA